MPQVEVTIDIDANGIMHVSAKDKNTGKENKITIKSDSGLTDAEIQRMVREAEENAESDAKAKELIEAKNSSDAASHSINKDYEKYKDQLTEEERTTYETAKTTLDEAMAGDNVETIKEAMNKLFESASPVMTKKQQAESAQTEQPATEAEQTVNAEFKEVDPTEKK